MESVAGRDPAPGDQAELGAPGEARAAAPAEIKPELNVLEVPEESRMPRPLRSDKTSLLCL